MSTPATQSDPKTAALVECLRIFARRGHDLRTSAQEQQQSDPGTATGPAVQTSMDPKQEDRQ